ncbi:MAG: helix-turn-helix transcriptional regulator [Clostridia bacterium]|nr:helix-turn-helix transcriptional regulator [Clostridia bacterium]
MDNNLGLKLQETRKRNKLSQEALAEKLGVSRQAISKWERGESAPDTENLIALSRIYGVSIDELLGNDSQPAKADLYEEPVDEITPEYDVPQSEEKLSFKEKHAIEKAKPPLYPKLKSFLLKVPVWLFVPIIYMVAGMLGKLWHPMWLIFFFIPFYYQLCHAVSAKNKRSFFRRLPIIPTVIVVFLCLGFFAGLWKYAWLLFLIIPIYYWGANNVKK